MNPTEKRKSIRLESIVERFNREQTEGATDAFMKLVDAICDVDETDRALKELVNF